MFQATLKKFTVIIALVWRLGILATVVILNYIGGLSKPECWQLIYMVLPVSCLYVTASFIYLKHINFYFILDKKADRKDVFWSIYIHAIYLAELLALLSKSFFGLSAQALFPIILIAECGCAVYGALYLYNLEQPANE